MLIAVYSTTDNKGGGGEIIRVIMIIHVITGIIFKFLGKLKIDWYQDFFQKKIKACFSLKSFIQNSLTVKEMFTS